MSIPLFELTAYELTSLIRARDVASMGARVAAIAAEQGVTAKQVLDAIWASGTITGQGARTAAVRAGAQSLARGAVHRLEQLGVQTVMRHATRQLSLRALGAVGTASMAGSAGGAAAATGMASSATAGVWSLGALVGAGLLIAVVVGAGFYLTRSGQPARTEAVDVADGALDSPPATTPGPLPTAPVADAAEAIPRSVSMAAWYRARHAGLAPGRWLRRRSSPRRRTARGPPGRTSTAGRTPKPAAARATRRESGRRRPTREPPWIPSWRTTPRRPAGPRCLHASTVRSASRSLPAPTSTSVIRSKDATSASRPMGRRCDASVRASPIAAGTPSPAPTWRSRARLSRSRPSRDT